MSFQLKREEEENDKTDNIGSYDVINMYEHGYAWPSLAYESN